MNWLRGKEIGTLSSLQLDTTVHFIWLSSEDKWVGEISTKEEIDLLNTKLQEQSAKMYVLISQLTSVKDSGTKTSSQRNMPYTVKPWRLEYKSEKVKV
jgi:hypothetical protein